MAVSNLVTGMAVVGILALAVVDFSRKGLLTRFLRPGEVRSAPSARRIALYRVLWHPAVTTGIAVLALCIALAALAH
jgi:hypothetical protein